MERLQRRCCWNISQKISYTWEKTFGKSLVCPVNRVGVCKLKLESLINLGGEGKDPFPLIGHLITHYEAFYSSLYAEEDVKCATGRVYSAIPKPRMVLLDVIFVLSLRRNLWSIKILYSVFCMICCWYLRKSVSITSRSSVGYPSVLVTPFIITPPRSMVDVAIFPRKQPFYQKKTVVTLRK